MHRVRVAFDGSRNEFEPFFVGADYVYMPEEVQILAIPVPFGKLVGWAVSLASGETTGLLTRLNVILPGSARRA